MHQHLPGGERAGHQERRIAGKKRDPAAGRASEKSPVDGGGDKPAGGEQRYGFGHRPAADHQQLSPVRGKYWPHEPPDATSLGRCHTRGHCATSDVGWNSAR